MPDLNPIIALIRRTFRIKGSAEHTQFGPTRAQETVTVLEAMVAGQMFDADFLAVEPFGKFGKGTMVPATGKTGPGLIVEAYSGSILPTYSVASLSLVQSAAVDDEVGQAVANALTATFNQGDAGALSTILVKKDGAQISSSGNSSPFTRNSNVVRILGSINYQAFVDYAAGEPKLVRPANTPDTRPAAVRSVNAPQAAESGLASNQVQLKGWQYVFFGPVAAKPTTSAAVRALPSKQLVKGALTLTLNTGTVEKTFAIVVPPGYKLTQVIDIESSRGNITGAYVASGVRVQDARPEANGGPQDYTNSNGVATDSTCYTLQTATTYPSNHQHEFTIQPI
ncbi:hypothetical protein [Hymenobacter tenuis]